MDQTMARKIDSMNASMQAMNDKVQKIELGQSHGGK